MSYRIMVVTDPDGNEFYFPYEAPLEGTGTLPEVLMIDERRDRQLHPLSSALVACVG